MRLKETLQIDVYSNPANESLSPSACADEFYRSHPELMDELKRPWIVRRLTKMIEHGLERGWPDMQVDTQQNLPGFEDLPKRIFLKNGSRKILNDATIGQVKQHLWMLRDRFLNHPKIKQIEAVLELMQKYTKINPKITWKKVKQRELESGSNFGS
jgi:hypothetical protein